MIASEDYFPFATSQAGDVSGITADGTGRRDYALGFRSPFRVWGRVLQTFGSILVQPLKTWMRLQQDVAALRCMDYTELQDIGINRMDIDAIRAGTYKRASSDDAERIVFCPEAGKPVTQAGNGNPEVITRGSRSSSRTVNSTSQTRPGKRFYMQP